MAKQDAYVEYLLELLAPAGAATARRMFGGHGVYLDERMMGLVAEGRFYLKVDAESEPRFRAAGCEPFVYEGGGKRVEMSYWSAPESALESAEEMLPWARLALAAAMRKALVPARRRQSGIGKPASGKPKSLKGPAPAPSSGRRAKPRRA